MLNCSLFTNILPTFREEKGQHTGHAEGEADREACHNVGSVDKVIDGISNRDTHSPQHEDIHYRWVFHDTDTVNETDDTIENRIGPSERKNNADIMYRHVKYCQIIRKQS